MPVTVAVDVNGESVHNTGPQVWKLKIETGDLSG
jgi:fumarate hydratase class I